MVFTDYGDMGLGQLQAGIGSVLNVFQQRQQQQQMQQLGQQIQSGDLLGAAQTAISRGDISTGLKLYELHRKTGDEAGLGSAIQGIFGGGTPAKLTTMGPRASAGVPADASAYAAPIAGGETSATDPTAYSRLGPVIGPGHSLAGDRAYGKFQVMGSNVGPWTKEILGQEMTPEEFLANPQAQEAVFKGKFGQYVQQTGDPKAAAAMWFSGQPEYAVRIARPARYERPQLCQRLCPTSRRSSRSARRLGAGLCAGLPGDHKRNGRLYGARGSSPG
jgi:hypothetical protein